MGNGPPRLPRLGIESNFLLGPGKKAVIDAALVYTEGGKLRPWAELPEGLRKVLGKEMWDGLSRNERLHLAAVYNKMETYGLWKHVTRVVGVKQKAEGHDYTLCPPGAHAPDGAEGFVFETGDHYPLYEDIFAAGFGTDGAAESALHPGQTSTRESTGGYVTHEVAAPDGLHVSLGPGNRFDAHVDKISPTNAAKAGVTQMDVQRGWLHHRHERVWPDLHATAAKILDKHTGIEIPGVDVRLSGLAGGPTLDQSRVPMPEDRNNPAAPLAVDVTLRFGK